MKNLMFLPQGFHGIPYDTLHHIIHRHAFGGLHLQPPTTETKEGDRTKRASGGQNSELLVVFFSDSSGGGTQGRERKQKATEVVVVWVFASLSQGERPVHY
jgi:hypothetical protein